VIIKESGNKRARQLPVRLHSWQTKKPPGAVLRYDGRLTTPSARLHIVTALAGHYEANHFRASDMRFSRRALTRCRLVTPTGPSLVLPSAHFDTWPGSTESGAQWRAVGSAPGPSSILKQLPITAVHPLDPLQVTAGERH
jgi:hypothetical protein